MREIVSSEFYTPLSLVHHSRFKETVVEQSLSIIKCSIKYVLFSLFHLSLGIVRKRHSDGTEASTQLSMKVK
jgi:hypothetical protein